MRWIFLLLVCGMLPASAAPTSLGPTSEEEAKILWSEGQARADHDESQAAVNALQRLVDRYPGHPHFLAAHLLLGESLLALGRAEEATVPLKFYIGAKNWESESIRARILLGEANLQLRKFHEVSLLSEEIRLKMKQTLESQLLQVQALLGLGHETRARKVMMEALQDISVQVSASVRGKAYGLELKLKLLECTHLPSRQITDESQIRNQLDRRGTCLLEALQPYRMAVSVRDASAVLVAKSQLEQAIVDYRAACAHPPSPLDTAQLKRTDQEKAAYRAELASLLQLECGKKIKMLQKTK